jgi:hypothetical protein
MNANDRLRCAELSHRLRQWVIGGAAVGFVIWLAGGYLFMPLLRNASSSAHIMGGWIPLLTMFTTAVLMGLWLIYWVRIAIDAQLFKKLADGSIPDLPALDAYLVARGWKKATPGAPLAPWRCLDDRILGTERLIKRLALSLLAATLPALVLLAVLATS